MNCTTEQFSGMDMVSPADNRTNSYITDVDNEYRKFSLNINVSSPKFSFSACSPNDVKVIGKW